jgi:hypothetical protein
MGYPSGPDRLLAMVDDEEAKSINSRFGNSRTNLINFLAQSMKIVPLTTQGAITISTRDGSSMMPRRRWAARELPFLDNQGKVIGVNFGVFTRTRPRIWPSRSVSPSNFCVKQAGSRLKKYKARKVCRRRTNRKTPILQSPNRDFGFFLKLRAILFSKFADLRHKMVGDLFVRSQGIPLSVKLR